MEMFIVPIQPMDKMGFSRPIDATPKAGLPFQNVLEDAIQGMRTTGEVSAQDGYNLAFGNVDDLAKLQIDSLKAETMVQTTVQLTSRIINAYKEVMQMQI